MTADKQAYETVREALQAAEDHLYPCTGEHYDTCDKCLVVFKAKQALSLLPALRRDGWQPPERQAFYEMWYCKREISEADIIALSKGEKSPQEVGLVWIDQTQPAPGAEGEQKPSRTASGDNNKE